VYGTGCARSDFTTCIPVSWEHLSGLNKLFLGYSILSKSVVLPALPQPYNWPEASGQAHTWPTCPMTHVVHGAPAYAEIRKFSLDVWCAKDEPINHFLNHWAYAGVWVECTTKLAKYFGHGQL
jgi:hypothetical protein